MARASYVGLVSDETRAGEMMAHCHSFLAQRASRLLPFAADLAVKLRLHGAAGVHLTKCGSFSTSYLSSNAFVIHACARHYQTMRASQRSAARMFCSHPVVSARRHERASSRTAAAVSSAAVKFRDGRRRGYPVQRARRAEPTPRPLPRKTVFRNGFPTRRHESRPSAAICTR